MQKSLFKVLNRILTAFYGLIIASKWMANWMNRVSSNSVTLYVRHILSLYTCLPRDLIKPKLLSLVKLCFNRESKTYLCTSGKLGLFSNKKYDSYKCWTCAEFCEEFTFLMETLMCNLKTGSIIRYRSWDSHGYKLCTTHSRCVLILLREGFYG